MNPVDWDPERPCANLERKKSAWESLVEDPAHHPFVKVGYVTYLYHLGVKPLAHLGATVREKHRAIRVHVNQSARLIHESCSERNTVPCDPIDSIE